MLVPLLIDAAGSNRTHGQTLEIETLNEPAIIHSTVITLGLFLPYTSIPLFSLVTMRLVTITRGNLTNAKYCHFFVTSIFVKNRLVST